MKLDVAVADLVPLRRLLIERRDVLKWVGDQHGTQDLVADDVRLLTKTIRKLNQLYAKRFKLGATARANMRGIFS